MCDAPPRAKELALEVGAAADGKGWPCLWVEKHVVVYGPRPDGKCQMDDATEDGDIYYTTQLGRAEAAGLIRGSDLVFSHYGKFQPTTEERALLEKDSVGDAKRLYKD